MLGCAESGIIIGLKFTHTELPGKPQAQSIRTLSWALPLGFSLLPIALLSIYSYQIASGSVRDLLLAQDLSETGNVSMLLQQDMGKSVALAEAFASAQGTVRLLREGDALGMTTRLKALTLSFPALKSAVLTDANGRPAYAYPPEAESLSGTVTFLKTVAASGRPGISPVTGAGSGASVTVAAPVELSGSIAGAVALEYRTEQIQTWLKNVSMPAGAMLSVIDHRGTVVASTDPSCRGASYAGVAAIQRALGGVFTTAEFHDPHLKKQVVATMLPVSVGRGTWLIVAQKTTESAYADLYRVRMNIGLAGGALTLVTLLMVVTIARIQRRNARLTRELQDKNLRLNETAAIVQGSNDAIVGFGRDGRIRTWNAAAEKMYGWTAKDTVGQSVSMTVPKDKADEFAELLTKVTGGETIQNVETVRQKADGSLVPVSITLSPIRDESGTVAAVSSIDRDITERRKIEQMKDDFISFVSHQLKAPITAIRWTLESVTDGDYGPVPEALKAPIEEISGVNAQNFRLINDILNASRIDRGVIAVETKPVTLKEVADRSLRDYRVAIQKAGLTLSMQTEGDALVVQTDLEKTAEAVTNSLSNAIKHTKSGGITVRTYKEGAFGCIDVTDTGEGMPKEIIDKLFTRTGILGNNTIAEKSAGLGLYIAKHFIELQGGSISVTSEPGKGTTFTYRIPLAG
jgi:PAS domain S-box-containing protein